MPTFGDGIRPVVPEPQPRSEHQRVVEDLLRAILGELERMNFGKVRRGK